MANQNLVWESLERAVIRQRRKDREQALLDLVEVAVLYHEELQRDDPAHMGRLIPAALAFKRRVPIFSFRSM